MKNKSILFVIGKLSGGGAERVISLLANWFSNRNYTVSVAAIVEDDYTYSLDSQVQYYTNNTTINNQIRRKINRLSFLNDTIQKIQPQVIISFTTEINIYSIFAKRPKNSKLLLSERNDPYQDPRSLYKKILRRLIYQKADGFVFQTIDAQNYFTDEIIRKSRVIPNPINSFIPNSINLKNREERFVCIGRLAPQKNIQLLIKAFKKFIEIHPTYTLDIYGKGELRDELEKLVNELHIQHSVNFKGYISNIYDEIISATAFILPSNYEGISNAMIESLALGIPTICTDCPIGGARMFIENRQNGILIPVNDELALYRAMLEIVENKALQKKLSKNSTSIRDKLNINSIGTMWEEFIDSVK